MYREEIYSLCFFVGVVALGVAAAIYGTNALVSATCAEKTKDIGFESRYSFLGCPMTDSDVKGLVEHGRRTAQSMLRPVGAGDGDTYVVTSGGPEVVTVINELCAALERLSAPAEDDEQQGCEHCGKSFDIESMAMMDDCWFCASCYSNFKEHFAACKHSWEPHTNSQGDMGRYCSKCCGFIADDSLDTPPAPLAEEEIIKTLEGAFLFYRAQGYSIRNTEPPARSALECCARALASRLRVDRDGQ